MRRTILIMLAPTILSAPAPGGDYVGPGFVILDSNAGTASSTITIPDSLDIGAVTVTISDFTHSWVGDIAARLTHPSGATVTLFNRPGWSSGGFPPSLGHSWNLGGDYTFQDGAALSFNNVGSQTTSYVLPSGVYRPLSLLASLKDLPAAGQWRLTIPDLGIGGGGSIGGWSLSITPATGAVCLPDGFCVEGLTAAEADALGGQYRGPSTRCVDVACLGACFVASSGNCVQLDGPTCLSVGGIWQGLGAGNCDPCPADTNGDGVISFFDLANYLAWFNAQDPRADLATPFGVFNFFDVATYLNLYTLGCP